MNPLQKQLNTLINLHGINEIIHELTAVSMSRAEQCAASAIVWEANGENDLALVDRQSMSKLG